MVSVIEKSLESPKSARDARLDVVRGLAIVAIVAVHVFRGLCGAGLLPVSWSAGMDQIVGLWCLSVFAFVGGTFVPRGVRARGVGHYVRDRAVRFLAVYLLWSLLQGAITLAASAAVNTPTSAVALFTPWRTPAQLWYLPFLVLVTVIFVPLQPWRARRGPWILLASLLVSLAFWGYDGGYIGTQGLGLVVFFVGGMVCGGERVKTSLDRVRPATAGAIALTVLALTSLVSAITHATLTTISWEHRSAVSVATGFVASVLATGAVLLLGQALRNATILVTLGRRSLDIYLAHIVMAAGTRILLVHAGITSPWVLVAGGLIAGVFGAVAVATLLRRAGAGWLFDGPSGLGAHRPAPQTGGATGARGSVVIAAPVRSRDTASSNS